jgi:hypothetical protein
MERPFCCAVHASTTITAFWELANIAKPPPGAFES